MSVVVVEPRTEGLIDLAIVKAYLHVEHSDHDALLQLHIDGAETWLDGPSGILGLALGPQQLRASRTGFGSADGFDLPIGPVNEIVSISWRDGSGEEQTVDAGVYEIEANQVRLAPGQSWPAGDDVPVWVTYDAGYAADQVPASVRGAMLVHIKLQYDKLDEKDQIALADRRDEYLAQLQQRRI